MAELPEIIILARQLNDHLAGLELTAMELGQPKCLNAGPDEFRQALIGRRLERVRPMGKWLVFDLAGSGPNLLVNPGMGMDLLALTVKPDRPPQFRFEFGPDSNRRGFTIRFWWFGYLRLARPGSERLVAGDLGPAPLTEEFTPGRLAELLAARPRRGLKAFLMDQKTIAGIGNVYVQDICFSIKAHPRTKIAELTEEQRRGLFKAIEDTLASAVARGMNDYEYDLFGRKDGWGAEAFLVGYRTGQPCPDCGAAIEKIKTGSTHSYICPTCQPERRA